MTNHKGVLLYVSNYRRPRTVLSCGHCVKRVKKGREQRRMLSWRTLRGESARYGRASADALVKPSNKPGMARR